MLIVGLVMPCLAEEVRLYSEFSGYRTAEIAAACVVEQLRRQVGVAPKLSCSSADISGSCRSIILENSLLLSFLRSPDINKYI